MKNILLLSSYNIFTLELAHQSKDKNINFYLLDISNNIYYNFQKKTKIKYVKDNIFIKIPLIKYLFLTLYAKTFIKRLNYKIDVAHILYNKIQYFFLINTLKNKSKKIVLSIFGGDFYNSKSQYVSKYVYDRVNLISFANPETKNDFTKKYPQKYNDKLKICTFGISHLDIIKNNQNKYNKEKIKQEYSIDNKSIVILCGSCADPNEQHEKIIYELKKIKNKYINKTVLIFPFAYGSNKKRLQKIKKLCQDKIPKIKTIFLDQYVSDKNICKLRIITDISINIKKIDQFSAAMAETLFCKGIIVAGSWLPYKILDKNKINYIKISDFSQLNEKLIHCINNVNKIKKQNSKNPEKIYKICSWKNNITNWKKLY